MKGEGALNYVHMDRRPGKLPSSVRHIGNDKDAKTVTVDRATWRSKGRENPRNAEAREELLESMMGR